APTSPASARVCRTDPANNTVRCGTYATDDSRPSLVAGALPNRIPVAGTSPAIARARVDFPAPEAPTIAVSVPAEISRSIPATGDADPRVMLAPWSVAIASGEGAVCAAAACAGPVAGSTSDARTRSPAARPARPT